MPVVWWIALHLISQPVAVEQLSRELELPVVQLRSENHKSDTAGIGSFFRYQPPVVGRSTFGILVPTADQSFSQPVQSKTFWPAITNGSVTDDVASSIRDKARQLQRQYKPFKGPAIHGLGVMEVGIDEYDLVLPVEHVSGIRVPREPEARTPEMTNAFFGLFMEMVGNGWIPLDYRYTNVVVDPETGEMRPVDVVLTTHEELEAEIRSNSKRGKLQLLQLAQTAVEIDRSSSDLSMAGYSCRNLVKELRAKFPGEARWEPGIIKQLGTPVPAAIAH